MKRIEFIIIISISVVLPILTGLFSDLFIGFVMAMSLCIVSGSIIAIKTNGLRHNA